MFGFSQGINTNRFPNRFPSLLLHDRDKFHGESNVDIKPTERIWKLKF